eukprot:UN20600
MTNPSNIRSRRALTRLEARVLARLGDELIEYTRTEQVFPLYVLGLPAGCDDVDMCIRPARSGKPFRAYFHGGNNKSCIPIRLQVT